MIFLQRSLLILATSILIVVATWSGYHIHQFSAQRAEVKRDYSLVNNITYGLLSVNAWRDHVVTIVTRRIDDFEFTPDQEVALKQEVSQILLAVINKADSMVDIKQKTIGGKLKKFAVKSFIKKEKLEAKVPALTETIVNELQKPKSKEKLKRLARSKLEEFGTITYDSANDVQRVEVILAKYGIDDVARFNTSTEVLLEALQRKSYTHTVLMISVMLVFIAIWLILRNQRKLHTPLFVMSVLLALVLLFVGLTSPMIEIDARIKELSFHIIGEQISFHDQVIFFQSKSIIDVITILIETHKYDSVIVGVLILIFSVVFPLGKLFSTKLYLLGNEKWRNNSIIKFFAFKSGKWSMADVNVVAIFMAYIGFKGILDNQLGQLNLKTESLVSISTNETSLQPGFIIFVAYVLFGLVLSFILGKITETQIEEKIVRVNDISSRPSVALNVKS